MPFDLAEIWSHWGWYGVLVVGYVGLVVMFFRGDIVPRKQVDQVQKMADTFKDAWAADQESKAELSNLLGQMTKVTETMEHVLTSLPVPPKGGENGS